MKGEHICSPEQFFRCEGIMKRILIVDDEPMNIRIAEHILHRDEAYEVCSAQSGEQTLEILEKEKPDMILLDVRMPGMDGFETMERIQNKMDIPVILVSADRDAEVEERAREAGARGYLVKPLVPELLRRSVRGLLGE